MMNLVSFKAQNHARQDRVYYFENADCVPGELWLPYSEFFDPEELADSQTGEIFLDTRFMHKVVALRMSVGFPFFVSSWTRTPETNEKVGGHPISAHMAGRATDLKGLTGAMLAHLGAVAWEFGLYGVGVRKPSGKPGMIHLDDVERAEPALWTYSHA